MCVKSRIPSYPGLALNTGEITLEAMLDTTSVYPSGSAAAPAAAPMMPPAPPRFFDKELLMKGNGQLLGDEPAKSVGGSARRKW